MRDLTNAKIRLKEIINNSKNALITMSSPDGDSIGSSLALKSILEQLNLNADIICSFEHGGRFDNYGNTSSIIIADLGRVDFSRYDVCFTLDAGHLSRLVRNELYPEGFRFPKSLEVVNIDHHESNDLFGTLNVNITDASCTAEVMDELFNGDYYMDSHMATQMYFSIVYDTGNFRFNVTDHLFEFALKCLKNGALVEFVITDFFNNRSIKQTKYEAVLLQRVVQEKNYIYTMAYHEDLEKYDIDVAKYLSATATVARDYIATFKDTDFGWVISERKHGEVKVEMRSKSDNSPILEITKALGGGGHKKACGAKVTGKTLEEVQDFIIKYLE